MITSETIREACGEREAMALYREVKASGDFAGFTRQYMHHEDPHVARNALWSMTKATDKELATLQGMLNELIDLAMTTESSAVRRLSLNIIERLEIDEENLRSDFLDFCLEHMVSLDEFPGIQTLCMKLAYRMCSYYPELMQEFMCTLEEMKAEYYKPAVKCLRNKILNKREKYRAKK